MKREKVRKCRFCGKSIMRDEFQDIHFDGKIACFNCYNHLNDTMEKIQRYWMQFHYGGGKQPRAIRRKRETG
jgi:protein-arginine kinase activator protein McsA